MNLCTQSESVQLTELPTEILVRIAACVAAKPSSALALAETCETFRKAVGSALQDRVVVNDEKIGKRWTKLYRNDVRHATLSTPFRTDPSLRQCCPLLSSPYLETASVRGDLNSFPLLATGLNLRSLSLQIRQAELHPQLLNTLSKLPALHTLDLNYCVDFSLLHLPHSQRCACDPLRRNPDALVQACSSVKNFSLACRCHSAQKCTIPYFPQLEHVSLKGFLPHAPPPSLQYMANMLKSLTLSGKHTPELAVELAPNVTGVHTVETVQASDGSRRLTEATVMLVATHCTQLRELRALLHRGAENGLQYLPPTVHTLNVGFRGLEDVRSINGLSLPKFDGNLLMKVIDNLPDLKELEISSALISDKAITSCIQSRTKWKRLSFTVHAQAEPLDKRFTRILQALCTSCTELDCLHIQSLPLVSIGAISSEFTANPDRLVRLQRMIHVFSRTFPFTDSTVVYDRMEEISYRVEERLRRDEEFVQQIASVQASTPDDAPAPTVQVLHTWNAVFFRHLNIRTALSNSQYSLI